MGKRKRKQGKEFWGLELGDGGVFKGANGELVHGQHREMGRHHANFYSGKSERVNMGKRKRKQGKEFCGLGLGDDDVFKGAN